MLVAGVVAGLLCACFQSVSYLYSRRFVTTPGASVLQLIAVGHLWMALFAVCLLPVLWVPVTAPTPVLLGWLVLVAGTDFLGQASFFLTIRTIPASRLSPLLGLKLVMLALIRLLALGQGLSAGQWLAVLLAMAAGMVLNKAGGRLPAKAWAGLLVTCLCYAISDLSVRPLVGCLDEGRGIGPSLLATALTYTLGGVYGLVLYRRCGPLPLSRWKAALPWAISWFLAMFGLFAAIHLAGVVLAVILQSSRGIISVAFGAIVAWLGHEHLEHRVSVRDRFRQVISAAMMLAAIALYLLSPPAGGQGPVEPDAGQASRQAPAASPLLSGRVPKKPLDTTCATCDNQTRTYAGEVCFRFGWRATMSLPVVQSRPRPPGVTDKRRADS